jgi:hypothetical protein
MRFVEQARKLAVNNIDPGAMYDRKSRHGVLFPDTIRSLIVGPSGCGKTNLVFTLLTHANGLKFENVYIYSKTLHQPKYVMLEEILSKVDDVNLFKFQENDSVLPPEKALPNSVFIFDDIIMESQSIVRSYFSRGRHNQIDVCYLAQSYSRVPKQLIRDNANFIVLFRQDEMNLKHAYAEHVSTDMSYSEFKSFCTKCWQRSRFDFIVISKEDERDNGRYRFGFDMFVVI